MSHYAQIENGKVINTIVCDENFAAEHNLIKLENDAGIGWDYVNGEFIDNRPRDDEEKASESE